MVWSQNYRQNGSDIVKHTFEWVSDGSGNATIPSLVAISGYITRVVIVPSAVAAPTTLYDLTLTDENGVDALSGLGANMSASATLSTCPGTPINDGTTASVIPVIVDGILTLNVSNAGATKAGTVIVYVR